MEDIRHQAKDYLLAGNMTYYARERGESLVQGPFDVEELKAKISTGDLSNTHMILRAEGLTPAQVENHWDFRWSAISEAIGMEAYRPAILGAPETPASTVHAAQVAKANNDVLVGGLWLFGGLAVTAFTYLGASGGGSYVVAWGAIIFGGLQFFRGLAAK